MANTHRDKDVVMREMDEALEKAKADLFDRMRSGKMSTVSDVVSWLRDWYREAGYARLCRLLLKEWN